jgi:phage gpG-like protein
LVETGALRRSLRTERIGNTGIVFTETPYAKAHNEGYEGQEEVYVSAHTRTRNGKTHDVKSFNRQQKTAIPQRQFMGQSKTLDDQCEEIIKDRMNKIFN